MRFLTDENVFYPIVAMLRQLGHDVIDVKEQRLFAIDDERILEMAIDQKRILITSDKGSANILLYPPATHRGIIVLATVPLVGFRGL